MKKTQILSEGYTKVVYDTDDPELTVIEFKDTVTAFRNIKRATIKGKGRLTCRVSSLIMEYLNSQGLRTHFVREEGDNGQVCLKVRVIPVRIIMRNAAAGSIVRTFGIPAGTALKHPVVEMTYKNNDLDNPIINRDHADALGIATYQETEAMIETSRKVNSLLCRLFASIGVQLVDFKIEFGYTADGTMVITDEISPDTCRFRNMSDGRQMDRDRYRYDQGDIIDTYQELTNRLEKAL